MFGLVYSASNDGTVHVWRVSTAEDDDFPTPDSRGISWPFHESTDPNSYFGRANNSKSSQGVCVLLHTSGNGQRNVRVRSLDVRYGGGGGRCSVFVWFLVFQACVCLCV